MVRPLPPRPRRGRRAGRDAGVVLSDVRVRLATPADIPALVALRLESSREDRSGDAEDPTFDARMTRFLERAIPSERWRIHVGELAGEIVATAYVQLVPKVPRPWPNQPWGYVTSVFARAEHRDHGVGTGLVRELVASAARDGLELLLLWPSVRSRPFYERLGFRTDSSLDEEQPWIYLLDSTERSHGEP